MTALTTTKVKKPTILLARLAWSYNDWHGFDDQGYNNREKFSFEYVKETGIAYEWWCFYEGFQDEYYYCSLPDVGENEERIISRIGNRDKPLVIYLSKELGTNKKYVIGFYAYSELNIGGYSLKINNKPIITLEDLLKETLPSEKININEVIEGVRKSKYSQSLKDPYRTVIRAPKEYSMVIDKECRIAVDIDFNIFGRRKHLVEVVEVTIDNPSSKSKITITRDKVFMYLIEILYRYLCDNPCREKDPSGDKVRKLRRVIDSYFLSLFDEKIDELAKILVEAKNKYGKQQFHYTYGLNDYQLREEFKNIEKELHELEECINSLEEEYREYIIYYLLSKHVNKGMNIQSLSRWLSIKWPDKFVALHERLGSFLSEMTKDLGIDGGYDFINKNLYAYLSFTRMLREASKRVRITMAEALFYLRQRYNSGISLIDYYLSKGYYYPRHVVSQFYVALKTKGFVILSGLTGVGKTKLAVEFARLLGGEGDNKKYLFIPVRADWRDTKPLLGYYNPLEKKYYETEFLKFVNKAINEYKERGREASPYFIILDEMNLSHVEYYFADLLSVLESGRDDKGFTKEPLVLEGYNKELKIPPNIYIIGTVNTDETTYMFSPKVLDRAFSIELHEVDLDEYASNKNNKRIYQKEELNELRTRILRDLRGEETGNRIFTSITKEYLLDKIDDFKKNHGELWTQLKLLSKILEPFDLHFGYRVLDEIIAFFYNAGESMGKGIVEFNDKYEIFDLAVLMKILPKIHGSRGRIEKPLLLLLKFSKYGLEEEDLSKELETILKEIFGEEGYDIQSIIKEFNNINNYKFKHTGKKILRMLRQLYETGFASFS